MVQQPDGRWIEVEAKWIAVGSLMRVRPGERIALDGVVLAGRSVVNEAPITGESLPVDKAAGDRVFAGTINQSGSLDCRATAAAGNARARARDTGWSERAARLTASRRASASPKGPRRSRSVLHRPAMTLMLTGDNRHTAETIAGEVGIDEAHGNLLPEAKAEMVAARVGPDAWSAWPATARADISLAMGAAGRDLRARSPRPHPRRAAAAPSPQAIGGGIATLLRP
jgi:cation transport ATPase